MADGRLLGPPPAVDVGQLLLDHVQARTARIADGRVGQASVVVDVEDVVGVVRRLVEVGGRLVAGGLDLHLGQGGGRLVLLAEVELKGGALGYGAGRVQTADAWDLREKGCDLC